jgi:hypothetical protein
MINFEAVLNVHAGDVSKAPLQILAAPVLPADIRFNLVALVSTGKPTVFRSSFDLLRLLLLLLSSNYSFRRPHIPEQHGIL